MQNPYRSEQLILNNTFKLITEENEFRMSHWVKGFGFTNATSGEVLMELITSFHLESFEENGDLVKIVFQVYPNGKDVYEVEIDLFKEVFVYKGENFGINNFYKTFKSLSEF